MKFFVFVLLMSPYLLAAFPPEMKTSSITDEMDWKNVQIGGGGYVTGVVIHPEEPDLVYVRTDIGGAYKWDEKGKKWIQLMDWIGIPNSNLSGVDGMALDPNKPDVLYLMLGKRINSSPSGIYKSGDRGLSWQKLYDVSVDANNQTMRWGGEPISVDPNNSEIIYAGTRRNGLVRSFNGGSNWETVNDVPQGLTGGSQPIGIRRVLFDGSSTVDERSERIYIGIPETGIYYSKDGGNTFSSLDGAPDFPNDIELTGPGELIVTHKNGVSVYRDNTWSDATPSAESGRQFVGLTVDINDPKHIVVSRFSEGFSNRIYRSSDGGTNWILIGSSDAGLIRSPDVPWWPNHFFSSATSALALDPHRSGRIFLTDWFGIWMTSDIWGPVTEWYTHQKGHEEIVSYVLASPPEGPPLYSLMADVAGFRHDNLDEFPQDRITRANEGMDITYCHSQPEYMALLDATSWSGDNTSLRISSNTGETWQTRLLPEGSVGGRLAYSATDPDLLVYLPANSVPYYTTDRGLSWNEGTGIPSGAVRDGYIWNPDRVLAADGIDGNRFYIHREREVYVSEDGGATWNRKNNTLLPSRSGWYHWLTTAPDMDGEVWVSLGGNGLWRSENGGSSFTKIQQIGISRLIGWGKAAPGKNHPTVFVYATINGQWGLFRSTDLGNSWTRLTDTNFNFGGDPVVVQGDGQMFGRVYVGTGGRGVFYGQPTEMTDAKVRTIPENFKLKQNYPNPFNPSTVIRYDIPFEAHTRIVVYDIIGRKITTLVSKIHSAGHYEVSWNASGYPVGIYLYRIETGSHSITRRMTLIK